MARLFLLALISLLVCAGTALAAAKRPDLGMLKVVLTHSEAQAGGTLTVKDRIGNAGKATAAPSQIGYYLSVDETRSADDVLLGRRKVGRLKAGRAASGSATLTVPSAIGLFRVIACADDKKRVKESVESNNCRAIAADFHVTAGP